MTPDLLFGIFPSHGDDELLSDPQSFVVLRVILRGLYETSERLVKRADHLFAVGEDL
jgi:hypothetical protein